jgi:hypothetical protein
MRNDNGECMGCKRAYSRNYKRKRRHIDPPKTHCRHGHAMVGDNLVITHGKRLDGVAFTMTRCRTCLRAAKGSLPRNSEEGRSQRRKAIARIDSIDWEILRLCDIMDLASKAELDQLRERRQALRDEKDGLAKKWRLS